MAIRLRPRLDNRRRARRDLKRHRNDWLDFQDQLFRLMESSVKEGILGDRLTEIIQPLSDAIADVTAKVQRAESTVTIVEAMEYMVPVPDSDDDSAWERPPNEPIYLNMDAMSQLRAAIREERTARIQTRFVWITPAVALGSIIVAILSIGASVAIAVWG